MSQKLVERLTQRLDLHRVFLFSYPFREEERQHLLLVINPVKGLAPKTLAPIVSLCQSDSEEELPFDLVLTGEWQNYLKQGSLYYTYASLPQHELYAGSKKGNPLFSHKTITGLLELAEFNYKKSQKTSDEFREAVDNFLVKGDYGRATFMLHQFLELRLKGFMATIGMNGGKAHNLEHLLKSIRSVAPQLQAIFPYDGPSVDIFRLLDESYTKARKQEWLAITPDEFGILMEKCWHAAIEMDSMVSVMASRIKAYQEQLPKDTEKQIDTGAVSSVASSPTVGGTPTSQILCEDFSGFPWPESYKKDVHALLDRIYQNHRPEQIIMLNYRTGGFSGNFLSLGIEENKGTGSKVELYLVVLMKNKGPFHFKCIQVGEASAMVVYLNVKTVQKNLEQGNRFFHTLWTKGWILRKKSTFEPSFDLAGVDWKVEYEQIKEIWENAKVCMGNVNETIQNMPNMKLDTGLLLTNSLLQIGVQTYLRCAVGFVPYDLHLTELMDWSGLVNTRLIDYFNPKSDIEKERLRLTVMPENVWWENIPMGLSKTNLTFHRTQAKEIVHFFDKIMGEVLEEMEGRVEQKSEQEVST